MTDQTAAQELNPIERIKNAADHLARLADLLEAEVDRIEKEATASEAAKAFLFLKDNYTELDNARKRFFHMKDKMDKFIVPSKLEAAGVDKLRIPEIGRSFYITTKYTASFLDKEKGFEWLRERDSGDIISETVNAGTLASYVKNMILEEGIDPPEDIVKFDSYSTTGSSKYTPPKKAV